MTSKEQMIEQHLKGRDIKDPRVINAMRQVDRALFVPDELKHRSYDDSALPIGQSQTISQPYVVAYMAQALGLDEGAKVLEIGSGCGYNGSVLAQIAKEVYSIEIIEWLANLAKDNIEKAGIQNVHIRHGDGYKGWAEEAPFDAIELTAAPPQIPETLMHQLKIGGKLLAPVGTNLQRLELIERTGDDEFTRKKLHRVRFVAMTGQAQSL